MLVTSLLSSTSMSPFLHSATKTIFRCSVILFDELWFSCSLWSNERCWSSQLFASALSKIREFRIFRKCKNSNSQWYEKIETKLFWTSSQTGKADDIGGTDDIMAFYRPWQPFKLFICHYFCARQITEIYSISWFKKPVWSKVKLSKSTKITYLSKKRTILCKKKSTIDFQWSFNVSSRINLFSATVRPFISWSHRFPGSISKWNTIWTLGKTPHFEGKEKFYYHIQKLGPKSKG